MIASDFHKDPRILLLVRLKSIKKTQSPDSNRLSSELMAKHNNTDGDSMAVRRTVFYYLVGDAESQTFAYEE